ncbi:hypothetical protein STEG23_016458 [Scotinomys teguina]
MLYMDPRESMNRSHRCKHNRENTGEGSRVSRVEDTIEHAKSKQGPRMSQGDLGPQEQSHPMARKTQSTKVGLTSQHNTHLTRASVDPSPGQMVSGDLHTDSSISGLSGNGCLPLPGTNCSLLLIKRIVTRTIVLQETIGKGQSGTVQ